MTDKIPSTNSDRRYEMQKHAEVKEDGRIIIYYSFAVKQEPEKHNGENTESQISQFEASERP